MDKSEYIFINEDGKLIDDIPVDIGVSQTLEIRGVDDHILFGLFFTYEQIERSI